jgi:hypothetical protein
MHLLTVPLCGTAEKAKSVFTRFNLPTYMLAQIWYEGVWCMCARKH